MGVSGLVSRGSRGARMFVEAANPVPLRKNSSVGKRCLVRPVGSVLTRTLRIIPVSVKPTATRGRNSGGVWDVDTVGVPGDWGYR